MSNVKLWLLLAIVVLAAVLRIWGIGQFPAGLNADEAAIGYNAYSLIHTGKDEYGNWFPLSFTSFGDYKPGLYFYIVLPFVATLGLNEFAVRLPSALLGIGTIILIYFLAKQLFHNKWIGISSAFLLAITPWHIAFSRGSWETNAATFFITLGIYLFIKKVADPKYLFFSLLSFLVSMYVYQSPRLVVPVLVLGLIGLYWRELFKSVKTNLQPLIIVVVILGILTIPLALQFVGGSGSARFSGLSFLSDIGPENRANELRGEHSNPSSLAAKVFHNKITAYAPQFFSHYVDHFRGDFLFINGDPIIRNKVPETGQFYLITVPLLMIGLVGLLKFSAKTKWVVLVWLLVSPLASSMTYQTPNAVRALTMVVPLVLIMSVGLVKVVEWFRNKKVKSIVVAILLIGFSYETVHFMESYFIHYPKRYPLSWEYGFREMVGKMQQYEGSYQKVVITDRYDQPYILTLFYKAALAQEQGKQFIPADYQSKLVLSERDKFNFGTVRSFDQYEFKEVKPEEVMEAKNTLFIVTPKEVPPNSDIIDRVKFPNGEDAFVFVKK
jgi:4-amino-4-deoxy-L-arabinose transferase-like glycosyltransferase